MALTFEHTSLFRPEDDSLSEHERSRIGLHRFLTIVGTAGLLLFGGLHEVFNPEATDPLWLRLAVTALYPTLLGLSYVSRGVCREYARLLRALLYVGITWLIVIVTINEMAPAYALGLLVAHSTLLLVVGLGAETIGPVLRFGGYVFGLTLIGGMGWGAPPEIFAILLGCLGTTSVVEGIAIWRLFFIREQLRKREERLRTITEHVSEGLYRSTPDRGLVYVNQAFAEMFGYEGPEQVLRADPTCYTPMPISDDSTGVRHGRTADSTALKLSFDARTARPSRVW